MLMKHTGIATTSVRGILRDLVHVISGAEFYLAGVVRANKHSELGIQIQK